MTGDRFTLRTASVLRAVHDYTEYHGFAPTNVELGRRLGLAAPSVAHHLAKLERMGLVTKRRNGVRSVRLTEQGVERLSDPVCHHGRPVLRIDLETGERKRYATATEAARDTFCSRTAVCDHASGRFKGDLAGRWRFNWISEE